MRYIHTYIHVYTTGKTIQKTAIVTVVESPYSPPTLYLIRLDASFSLRCRCHCSALSGRPAGDGHVRLPQEEEEDKEAEEPDTTAPPPSSSSSSSLSWPLSDSTIRLSRRSSGTSMQYGRSGRRVHLRKTDCIPKRVHLNTNTQIFLNVVAVYIHLLCNI